MGEAAGCISWVSGIGRGLRVQGSGWSAGMVNEASVERGLLCAGGFPVVAGEFHSVEVALPVCAFAVDVGAKHVFDSSDGAL